MAEYLHGAYGVVQAAGAGVAARSASAIVYVGTAPVQTVEGGASTLNRPIVVNNIAEAKQIFGYSDDWASFTLCEAMHAHLELNGVGPLILINVLDPATHRDSEATPKSLTPVNGRLTIADAELAILDSVTIVAGSTPKTKGTDYDIVYNASKKAIIATELTAGALGTSALTVTYNTVDPSAVTAAAVIGSTDGLGLNTGLYAVANVYQETGYIPSFLLCPGFSSTPSVHTAMLTVASKINGHWDAWVMADLPILDGSTPITLATAPTWKQTNGYNAENESVYFPMASGTDGSKYHISVLAAANFQTLLAEQDGIPYKTASNTACPIIENLYLGANVTGRVYSDDLINRTLNKNGISSAAYVGGQWVIWGCHAADYNPDNAGNINISETNRMMLYYISNDFQHRRTRNVDKPLTANDIKTIVSEEQSRLDALVKIGALTYGEVHTSATEIARSDVVEGNYTFTFNVTTTPLARSLTAIVNWTPDGFETYYESFATA